MNVHLNLKFLTNLQILLIFSDISQKRRFVDAETQES